jgi:competence protein ComEA
MRWRHVRGHLAVVLVNLIVMGAAVWVARAPQATAVRIVPAPTSTPAPAPTPVRLHVYVSGAVATPDVVVLADGARVRDAVQTAGGFTLESDRAAVNLAAPLADGQQVHVPVLGEAPPVPVGVSGGSRSDQGAAAGIAGAGGGSSWSDVNINTASAAELEGLPGIGPALAARIVGHRTEHGPFAQADDLLAVSGIGAKTLARFADLVTVR